jgi:uncharacterized protein
MKMSGEEIIPASRQTVWKALNDIDVLKRSIPGCETISKESDTRMSARVVVKVGPVKAGFNGVVTLSDLDPPNGYRISGEGKGGLAGFASGGATVRLDTVPEGTKLSYDVDAQVGGKLAMLGSRLIDSSARSLAGQFFERFAEIAGKMKEEVPAPAAAVEAPAAPAPAAKPVKAPAKKPAVKKAAVRKPAAKKPAAKKPAAKKSAAKKPARKR